MPRSGGVSAFVRERGSLLASARPGSAAARRLSDLTDGAVSALAEGALSSLGVPWAVLATGGWGARRLLPRSDLDLLIVTQAPASELGPALSSMLYPLWDAGLDVGHQVRTRRQHARLVRDDFDTLTATLTGRLLAGDVSLGERVLSETAAFARRERRRFLCRLAARERPGSPFLLEPDLKHGAGGQRDLDELAWTASVLSGGPCADHGPLVGLGLLDPSAGDSLTRAADTITAARWETHLRSSRASSVLTLDVADEVGKLAQKVQATLAETHYALLAVRAAIAGADPGLPPEPLTAQELFAALDEPHAVDALDQAAWSGRMDDLVPGMSDLMTLRRPGLTHTHTVGAHAVRTASLLSREIAGGAVPPPVRRPLLVAGLLHDIGKVHRGPGHEARGARMAATIAPRFGLTDKEADDALALVRQHLLLVRTALEEDVHDEDVVLRVAARLRRTDLAVALQALTEADARATGPGAWGEWHAALVGDLTERVISALVEDPGGATLATRAAAHRSEAVRLARDDAEVLAFVRSAPLRYLASQRPPEIVAHGALAALARPPGAPPQVIPSPGRARGTHRVTVLSQDRRGLFAALAGAFALSGLDILSVEAFSAADGVALDVFVVRPDTLAGVGPDTWSRLRAHLAAALADRRGTDARVAARRRHYALQVNGRCEVSIRRTGAYATAVHVSATDRVGLLYEIARAIEEEGLDVRWAKAATRGSRAFDVFHVTDASGEPVDDPGILGHLSMRIRERTGSDG